MAGVRTNPGSGASRPVGARDGLVPRPSPRCTSSLHPILDLATRRSPAPTGFARPALEAFGLAAEVADLRAQLRPRPVTSWRGAAAVLGVSYADYWLTGWTKRAAATSASGAHFGSAPPTQAASVKASKISDIIRNMKGKTLKMQD